MPRPKRKRQIQMAPKSIGFRPTSSTDEDAVFDIELGLDEYESLRLADYEGLSQEEAAIFMKVSRPTFARIYELARKKIVTSMVENKSMQIAGGHVNLTGEWYRCHDCDDVFIGLNHNCDSKETDNLEHINKSLNRGKKFYNQTTDICECTSCHQKIEKKRGVPCRSIICNKCGTKSFFRLKK